MTDQFPYFDIHKKRGNFMTAKERNDYFYVCALIEYIARETLKSQR